MNLAGGKAAVIGHRQHLADIAVLQCHQSQHQLGQAAQRDLGVRVIGIYQRAGVAFKGKGSLSRIQATVGAVQGHEAVDGAAAVQDAYAAIGQIVGGGRAIHRHILGLLRRFLRMRRRNRAGNRQRQGGKAGQDRMFFHNSPSLWRAGVVRL